MTEAAFASEEPFEPKAPNEGAELKALARAIDLAEGFSLLFAVCNQASHRDELIQELTAKLPARRIVKVPVLQPVRSLLDVLREHLAAAGQPDAVFVYGMENWLPAGKAAEEAPFVLNLNAARNHFPQTVSCPMVLWVPQYLLSAIANGAPDFASVRSGVYSFAMTPQAVKRVVGTLTGAGWSDIAGLSYHEKLERVSHLSRMLREYEALAPGQRDPAAEARLLHSLALFYWAVALYPEAEQFLQRALAIEQEHFGEESPRVVQYLNQLAAVYLSQGDFESAEAPLRHALELSLKKHGTKHPSTAAILSNLGQLLRVTDRRAEAETVTRQALDIYREASPALVAETAISLSNLAGLFAHKEQNGEAERLYLQALDLTGKAYGDKHPATARILSSLAILYAKQGRYAEAEPLYKRAIEINENLLSERDFALTADLFRYAWLLDQMGREEEAMRIKQRVKELGVFQPESELD